MTEEPVTDQLAQEKHRAAWRVQSAAVAAGDLLVWAICRNPSDYPGQYTARPHSTRTGRPESFVLVADTYDQILLLLPPGLFRIPRDPSDDPFVVESWI